MTSGVKMSLRRASMSPRANASNPWRMSSSFGWAMPSPFRGDDEVRFSNDARQFAKAAGARDRGPEGAPGAGRRRRRVGCFEARRGLLNQNRPPDDALGTGHPLSSPRPRRPAEVTRNDHE